MLDSPLPREALCRGAGSHAVPVGTADRILEIFASNADITPLAGFPSPLSATAFLQCPGLEPLANQAEDDTVLHSLLQKRTHVLMVDRVEEGLDAQVDDPVTSH